MTKLSIFSLTHHAFAEAVRLQLGKGYQHAGLAYEELFRTGRMTCQNPAFDNATALRSYILENVDLDMPKLITEKSDGATGKFLLRTHDSLEIESVCIPMQSGGTLCVSSQVGCRMGCAFCETGRMGLLRNLTVSEIISQVFTARHTLGFDFKNIVFMGMGEPFDNYDHVMEAIKVLLDAKGFGFGCRHISVSTSGCVDGIERFTYAEEMPNLAVSINAPTDELRNRLMPVNRKYNLQQLHDAMRKYCEHTGREILVAYVLMKGQNDTLEHADQLAAYLRGLNVKVNLIPYNAQSRDRFASPDEETVNAFSNQVRSHGYYTLVRSTKGQRIMAACGQLGNVKLRRQLLDQQIVPAT
ncbi:MAG: 23S rRNA (adenine(2503)-C(2))-methyltransferase RlmN [Parachlamydiaceae bacterium]|nr:23S rRNA (adenine(2503)-C(2))-methyltransferase RlmN [Parachlamydiaceae bacterium]